MRKSLSPNDNTLLDTTPWMVTRWGTRAFEYAFSAIVTAGLVLTCLVIAPLILGAHLWVHCIKRA